MLRRLLVVILAAIAFAGGLYLGSTGLIGFHPPTMTGDGVVGDHVVTLYPDGNTANSSYGVKGSVAWRDAKSADHADGWPDCLQPLQSVTGIRFTGATVWDDDTAVGRILWVDCSGG